MIGAKSASVNVLTNMMSVDKCTTTEIQKYTITKYTNTRLQKYTNAQIHRGHQVDHSVDKNEDGRVD